MGMPTCLLIEAQSPLKKNIKGAKSEAINRSSEGFCGGHCEKTCLLLLRSGSIGWSEVIFTDTNNDSSTEHHGVAPCQSLSITCLHMPTASMPNLLQFKICGIHSSYIKRRHCGHRVKSAQKTASLRSRISRVGHPLSNLTFSSSRVYLTHTDWMKINRHLRITEVSKSENVPEDPWDLLFHLPQGSTCRWPGSLGLENIVYANIWSQLYPETISTLLASWRNHGRRIELRTWPFSDFCSIAWKEVSWSRQNFCLLGD